MQMPLVNKHLVVIFWTKYSESASYLCRSGQPPNKQYIHKQTSVSVITCRGGKCEVSRQEMRGNLFQVELQERLQVGAMDCVAVCSSVFKEEVRNSCGRSVELRLKL